MPALSTSLILCLTFGIIPAFYLTLLGIFLLSHHLLFWSFQVRNATNVFLFLMVRSMTMIRLNLFVTMDQALTLDQHVKYLICSCFFLLKNTAKVMPIVSQGKMEILTTVTPSSLTSAKHPGIVYKWSNMLLLSSWPGPPEGLMRHCWFLFTASPSNSVVLVINYGALHGQAFSYIRDLLQPCVTSRCQRSSDLVMYQLRTSQLSEPALLSEQWE